MCVMASTAVRVYTCGCVVGAGGRLMVDGCFTGVHILAIGGKESGFGLLAGAVEWVGWVVWCVCVMA